MCSSALNQLHEIYYENLLITGFIDYLACITLRKKCICSELFWSLFSRIQTGYGKIRFSDVFRRIKSKHWEEKG